jgi:hypothetical protein
MTDLSRSLQCSRTSSTVSRVGSFFTSSVGVAGFSSPSFLSSVFAGAFFSLLEIIFVASKSFHKIKINCFRIFDDLPFFQNKPWSGDKAFYLGLARNVHNIGLWKCMESTDLYCRFVDGTFSVTKLVYKGGRGGRGGRGRMCEGGM